MNESQITVLIADDHPIFRKGLREILDEVERIHVVAECAEGESALASIRSLQPRIAILDLEMPLRSGLDVAAEVQREHLPTCIIMLTICDRIDIFDRAMGLGALGYILKDSAPLDLIHGIDTVLRGDYFISPSLAGHALRHSHAIDGAMELRLGLSLLTQMERRILHLIAENKSSTEIGESLNISPRTVDTHRSNINHKLGLKGSHALVRFALQNKAYL